MIRFTRKTKSGHSGEIIEKPEVQKAGEGDLLYAARFWYRVDDFRIICNIQDDKILVTVLRIADRKEPVFGKI